MSSAGRDLPTSGPSRPSGPSGVRGPLEALVEDVLGLERIEVDIFRGHQPQPDEQPTLHVFGGQVAAQALSAAGRTVPDGRVVHSLHAYFLRRGDPGLPIVYQVDRLRDGRSFTTRRVRAVQHGAPIFMLSASFQVEEPGLEHQAPMPPAPPPESLPRRSEALAQHLHRLPAAASRPWPVDVRYVDGAPWEPREQPSAHSKVWMRADGLLPADPLLHTCVLTYASDMTLLDTVLVPHGLSWPGLLPGHEAQGASVDHAMWFHRPVQADDWLLYVKESPSATAGRGIASGRFYTRDGLLVASAVQEGMVRRLPA